jgi:hypothetical protein
MVERDGGSLTRIPYVNRRNPEIKLHIVVSGCRKIAH